MDYHGPDKIPIKKDNLFNMECFRAKDLVVQEFDRSEDLWATRGLMIYCLKNNDHFFRKVARIPSGFSLFWLNNLTLIRRFTHKPECAEMTINGAGQICAFASGYMWISQGIGKKFQKTLKLPNYGIGIGRGVMSTGISQINNEGFLIGEYFDNPSRNSVRIFEFNLADRSWKNAFEFLPGHIRHIHALQRDPFTGKFWICTGDEGKEPMIGWSDDYFRSIVPIGQGSQAWRACQLVFTEDAVYWGTDTGSPDIGGIYKWDKVRQDVEQLYKIAGAIFFATRLSNGIIVMSTDREGFTNETDDKTRLIIINNHNIMTTIECGSWNYKKKGLRYNFAKLRIQRNQGSNNLVISCLNQKEIPEGELLIFSEEQFNLRPSGIINN